MPSLADTIQVATGVAGLAGIAISALTLRIAVLQLREDRLHRAAARAPAAPVTEQVTQEPQAPSEPSTPTGPPSLATPAEPGVHATAPQDRPRFVQYAPYLLILAACYSPTATLLATNQTAWLVLAFVLLAVSLVLVVLGRRASIRWVPRLVVAACAVGALSLGAVQNAFWPPTSTMREVLVGAAIFGSAGVGWLLINWYRSRRVG